MNITLYIALAAVITLSAVFIHSYFRNKKKERMKSPLYRSERSQAYMDAAKKHLALSGILPGYNEDQEVHYPERYMHKNANTLELWRVNSNVKTMPPLYLFTALVPQVVPVKKL